VTRDEHGAIIYEDIHYIDTWKVCQQSTKHIVLLLIKHFVPIFTWQADKFNSCLGRILCMHGQLCLWANRMICAVAVIPVNDTVIFLNRKLVFYSESN